MGERCCCQEEGDTWSSLDLFFPPYFTSSQSFFLFFLFAGFFLLFVSAIHTLLEFSAGLVYWNPWNFAFFLAFLFSEQHCFFSLSPSLVSNDGFVFLQRELVRQDCLFRGIETRIVLFLIVLTTLDTSKRQEENASSRLSLSQRYPHTPSNLTTKTMDCVSFCFSAFICFAIWETG